MGCFVGKLFLPGLDYFAGAVFSKPVLTPSPQWCRPGGEFGGTEHFFADQDFLMTIFPGKFLFSRPNILMTFFSHRPCFPDFSFLFPASPYLYCVKCHI